MLDHISFYFSTKENLYRQNYMIIEIISGVHFG